jgi:hypothetical protein
MSAGLAPAGMAASFAALAHQAAGQGVLAECEHRGQRMAGRQRRELFHAPVIEGTGADQDRTDALLRPSVRAAASRSAMTDGVPGKAGSARTPNRAALCNRGHLGAIKMACPGNDLF